MENNGFKRAGSLSEEPIKTNNAFLKPAGDLEEKKSNDNGMSYFQMAGDLDAPNKNNSFKFEEKEETPKTPEEIRTWLKSIVSGEKKATYAFGEGLQITGAGQKFVSIEELRQMVKNGDNIIKAEYFENMNMVMIEFESFSIPSKSR